MENNNKQGDKYNYTSKPSTIRNILSLVLLVGLVVMLFFITTWTSKKEIGEAQFKTDILAEKIESVNFSSNYIEVFYKKEAGGNVYYIGPGLSDSINEIIDEYNKTATIKVDKTSTIVSDFSWGYIIMPIVMIGGAILIIYIFARQIGKTNKQGMDFIKNRARVALSTVRFSDVAGADEEKAEVREIVEFLKSPYKFTQMGARIPRGVLMVGPPGTGKTLLAKAIAGEANVPFFTISGSDFMELYVGVGASRVRDLFDKAKKNAPCIVFIDEIDAIGRQRGTGMGGGSDEREQTLNQLLVQMDGFETNEGIIVIAATNRVDILDPALLRPGRFDRQIYIHVPDVKGREEILNVHARNKKFASDVDFKQVARVTSGFTGAELENLLNESAILAARDNKKCIDMRDISEGIDKVTMGPQKKSRVITDKDKRITAFHESGHAVVGRLVKNSDPIHEVSIVPRGSAAGYTVSRPDTDDTHISRTKLLDTITMMLSGRKAEEIFIGDYTTGASNDIERANGIARKMVTEWGMGNKTGLMHLGSENSYFLGKDYMERATYSEHYASLIDEEIKSILNQCEAESERIITENKSKLETMANVLLQKETIYSNEVDMIMNGATSEEVIKHIDESLAKTEENEVSTTTEELVDGLKSNIIKTDAQSGEKSASTNPAEREVLKGDDISESFSDAIEKTKNNSRKK